MCRGLPGRVLAVDAALASVDFWGTPRAIRVDLIDEELRPGDYVMCHLGIAVRRIPPDDVDEILALYDAPRAPSPR